MTKDQANQFAKQYGWTGADAERAYASLDLKNVSEQDLLLALIKFAGPELSQRQRLQAAQKGEVTKKKNYIKKIEADFQQKIEDGEKKIHEMQSTLIPIIIKLYSFGKVFGLKDPWLEALIATYEQYYKSGDEGNQNDTAA